MTRKEYYAMLKKLTEAIRAEVDGDYDYAACRICNMITNSRDINEAEKRPASAEWDERLRVVVSDCINEQR